MQDDALATPLLVVVLEKVTSNNGDQSEWNNI